jgi:beta-xylosidase
VTTTLTARAPTPGGPHRQRRGVHSGWTMVLGAVLVLAGGPGTTRTATHATDHLGSHVAGPTPALPTPSSKADGDPTRPASASAPRPDPVNPPRGEHSRSPQRLAPQPPVDGRDAPDPAVVHHGNLWALFSTQVGFLNIPVAVSDDLGRWSEPVDALPRLPGWAEWGHTWAPGVLRRDNGFVLYFAARSRALGAQCIGAATSTQIEGPYTSPAPDPLVCQSNLGGSIDPQPFVDRDGATYLLWKADANAIGETSQLFAQRLRPDGLALTGKPVALLRSDAGWEQPLIENPALLAIDGSYLLLYSGGWWESAGYATGYAVCRTPLGPCEKQTTQHPILAGTGDQAGTGGASIITGPGGDHWLAYHAWKSDAIGYHNAGARSLHFASISWEAGQLVVAHQR